MGVILFDGRNVCVCNVMLFVDSRNVMYVSDIALRGTIKNVM